MVRWYHVGRSDVGLDLCNEMWEVVVRMCDGDNGLEIQVRGKELAMS